MTLLEAISPTARQLLAQPVCATKKPGSKVHALRADNHPLCGGGYGGKQVTHWQQDIGPVNCRACLAILERGSHEQA